MGLIRIKAESISSQVIDDELIVLNEVNSTYLRVTGAGLVLWPLLVEGATIEDLEQRLCDQFQLPTDQAHEDVAVFVSGLRDNELVDVGA